MSNQAILSKFNGNIVKNCKKMVLICFSVFRDQYNHPIDRIWGTETANNSPRLNLKNYVYSWSGCENKKKMLG